MSGPLKAEMGSLEVQEERHLLDCTALEMQKTRCRIETKGRGAQVDGVTVMRDVDQVAIMASSPL